MEKQSGVEKVRLSQGKHTVKNREEKEDPPTVEPERNKTVLLV